MQTLESIRRKTESASELLSVVKTMKVMAAVSIRQCERAVASLAEYNHTIEMGLQILLRRDETDIQLAGEPARERLAVQSHSHLHRGWGSVVLLVGPPIYFYRSVSSICRGPR